MLKRNFSLGIVKSDQFENIFEVYFDLDKNFNNGFNLINAELYFLIENLKTKKLFDKKAISIKVFEE